MARMANTAQALLAELEDLRRVLDSPYATASSPSARLSARLQGAVVAVNSCTATDRYTSHGSICIPSLTPRATHNDRLAWVLSLGKSRASGYDGVHTKLDCRSVARDDWIINSPARALQGDP